MIQLKETQRIKKLNDIDDEIQNIEELDSSLRNKVLRINEKYEQILKDYNNSAEDIDKFKA